MKISVIIPTYNEEKVINDCLQSLVQQTRTCEIIAVDDGSTDKTLSVLSEFKISNLKFKIIQQDHLGPGAARNLGASKSTEEILVFVDADMTFDKDFIAELVKPIEEGKTQGTFTKAEYVSNWDNVWARCWNYTNGLFDKRRIPADYPETAPVFRAILKTEFEKAGGFTPGIGWTDDWSLSRKLGYQAVAANAICYHANPDSLVEAFGQARWIGKNEFISGTLGRALLYLIKYSWPVSLLNSFFVISKTGEIRYLPFKIVYDIASTIGIIEGLVANHRNK